jgi:hypothetical protein
VFQVQAQLSKISSHEVHQKGAFLIQKKKEGIDEKQKEFILLRFWTVLTLEMFYYYSGMEFRLLVKTQVFKLCKEFFEKEIFCFKNSVILLTKVLLENNTLSQQELDSILLDYQEHFISKLSDSPSKAETNQLTNLFVLSCSQNWFMINSRNFMLCINLFSGRNLQMFKVTSAFTILLRMFEFFQSLLKEDQNSFKKIISESDLLKMLELIEKFQSFVFNDNNFHLIPLTYFKFFVNFYSDFIFNIFLSSKNLTNNNILSFLNQMLKKENNKLINICKIVNSNLQEYSTQVIERFYQQAFCFSNENLNLSKNDVEDFSLKIFGNLFQYGVVGVSAKKSLLEKQ